MKIALHFYGHLRTFRDCMPSTVKHVIQDHNADVFVHTWDEIERTTQSWHRSTIPNAKISAQDIEFLKRTFPQVSYVVEAQINVDATQETGLSRAHESMKKSLHLREDAKGDQTYDLVVITRPDIMFLKDIDLVVIAEALAEPYFNSIIAQASYIYPSPSMWMSDSFGGRDCLMFGNMIATKRLSSMDLRGGRPDTPKTVHRSGENAFDILLQGCGLSTEILKFSAPEYWAIKRKDHLLAGH